MRSAALVLGLSVLSAAAFAQRRPVPVAPTQGEPVEAVLAGLQQATEGLKTWRAALEAGADVEEDDFRRLEGALEELGVEFKALHQRSRVNKAREQQARDGDRPDPGPRADTGVSTSARPLTEAWTEDARAFGEGAASRREEALAELRATLQAEDPVANLAALRTLQAIGDVEYDKAGFRPLILPFVREAGGATLNAALYALYNTDPRPEDLSLVHAAWERDPDALGTSTLHLLRLFGNGDLTGRSEEISLAYLAEVDGHRVNAQLNGLWGARVGPALEARVLELASSADHELRHGAIYFGLSTFEDKSAAVVEALIDTLSDPDWNNSGRALWGLGHGVPVEHQPRVAEVMVELHNARSDPKLRERSARLVELYGDAAQIARLKR